MGVTLPPPPATLALALAAVACAATAVASTVSPSYLAVNGSTGLVFNGKPVFLSGANLAWIDYGNDFGNNQSNAKACALQSYLRNISAAGGNSMRIWLFVEGQSVPEFDKGGDVIATDAANSMLDELRSFLDYAASQNVFVTLTLWNGALMRQQNLKNLIRDTAKLQTFIDNALIPLVNGLKGKSALAAWEIMNEPEGSVDPSIEDSNPCFATKSVLGGSGAGWAGGKIPMKELLRFFNLQAAAIRAADPKSLVTVGSWSQYASTDAKIVPGKVFFNYYKDECLIAAGGQPDGTLSFYQIHTYAHGGKYDPGSPFGSNVGTARSYALDKPMVIGEFSAGSTRGGRTIQSLYRDAMTKGFSGAWDWSLKGGDGNDDEAIAVLGMGALKNEPAVHIDIGSGGGGGTQCSCSDTPPPPGTYTCAQQAGWGKCGASFMRGYCCRSCHACRGCR